jgi:hypothetical protein
VQRRRAHGVPESLDQDAAGVHSTKVERSSPCLSITASSAELAQSLYPELSDTRRPPSLSTPSFDLGLMYRAIEWR